MSEKLRATTMLGPEPSNYLGSAESWNSSKLTVLVGDTAVSRQAPSEDADPGTRPSRGLCGPRDCPGWSGDSTPATQRRGLSVWHLTS
ncbi:Regulator Of Microtubule Dynamics Protein 1 [Manis pentadactyla]|nr:Regulator Of Microtubule Dynamics Protein 1 [Manis pentadactyla]